jgi:hypothetical protein
VCCYFLLLLIAASLTTALHCSGSSFKAAAVHDAARATLLRTWLEAKVPQRCGSHIAPPPQLLKADDVHLCWCILCRPQHSSPPAIACGKRYSLI